MSLLDEMRLELRVTTNYTDSEISRKIAAAIADMRRCGVKDALLDAEEPNPLVVEAVAMYCHAYYGMDNATERPQFIEAYNRVLCDLLNSKANEYLFPDEETPADEPTEGDEPSDGDGGGASGGGG